MYGGDLYLSMIKEQGSEFEQSTIYEDEGFVSPAIEHKPVSLHSTCSNNNMLLMTMKQQAKLMSPSAQPTFLSETADLTTGSSRRHARLLKRTVMNNPESDHSRNQLVSPNRGTCSGKTESLLNFEDSFQRSLFEDSVNISSVEDTSTRNPLIDVAQAPWQSQQIIMEDYD